MGFVERRVRAQSPMKESESESTLYFHPYESWTNEGEWEITMPAGEDILSVASGSSWVAAVIEGYLQFTHSAVPRGKSFLSKAHQYRLPEKMTVWPSCGMKLRRLVRHQGDQVLAYAMYNMRYSTQLARGRVALSSQSTLTYLGSPKMARC